MKAAVVRGPGQTPAYGEFPDPVAAPGENRIRVSTAALSHNVRSRASGAHYSASGQFPSVVGIDGVGHLDDGSRIYFVLPRAPYGSMAETAVAPSAQCLPVPDGLDDVTTAAIVNPGLSAWAAFKERARLKSGDTVLVNGATGTAGRLAVQIARHLGANKVIATGRNSEALREVSRLGADVTIPLIEDEDALADAFKVQFAQGVDVVIDYLWGENAERLLFAAAKAGTDGVPIRFVQVGSISGQSITLPGAVLHASAIELTGSGIGSIALDRLVELTGELLQAAVPGGFKIATNLVPLPEVEQVWSRHDSTRRTVFTVNVHQHTQPE